MGKIAGVIVAMFRAYQKVDDAQRNLYAANENLAEACADLPWTIGHICCLWSV